LALLIDNFAVVDPTIDVKTHIFHFDDENEQCKVSKQLQTCRNSSVIKARYTTISITKSISKPGILTSKNAVPL
tara:strand:- start:8330 stop:8551 length:222 start_codon:yes stop_codon:yes gene_type:complete